MACVSQRTIKRTGKPEYYIQFSDHTKTRRKLYGFTKKTTAIVYGEKIDMLVLCKRRDEIPDKNLLEWLDSVPDDIYETLSKWDIVPERRHDVTVKELTDLFVVGKFSKHKKPSTIKNEMMAVKRLNAYFGENRKICSIKVEHAEEFDAHYRPTMAPSTWCRIMGMIKGYFIYAREQGWVLKNPFTKLKSGNIANPSRMEFVSNATISRVLEYCRDSQDRLIVCLARYGGLRIPSELQYMTWDDIDFENNRFLVKSPKKENKVNQDRGIFTGDAQRYVPLFPELQKAFLDYFEDLPENSSKNVFDPNRIERHKVAKMLRRVVRKAGLRQWERVFHNLRSTRETELINQGYPIKDVCAIIGNSPVIAMKHYVQVSSDLFKKASETPTNEDILAVNKSTPVGTEG